MRRKLPTALSSTATPQPSPSAVTGRLAMLHLLQHSALPGGSVVTSCGRDTGRSPCQGAHGAVAAVAGAGKRTAAALAAGRGTAV
eukprot:COSAG02_NODE_6467_length_3554_cov_1.593343_4_plen_85_part_00